MKYQHETIVFRACQSPSMRREWIEMMLFLFFMFFPPSPSMRREWIEILQLQHPVFLPLRLPPCGGSGLKLFFAGQNKCFPQSPSMRREWIEMLGREIKTIPENSLPPCGGSGLK